MTVTGELRVCGQPITGGFSPQASSKGINETDATMGPRGSDGRDEVLRVWGSFGIYPAFSSLWGGLVRPPQLSGTPSHNEGTALFRLGIPPSPSLVRPVFRPMGGRVTIPRRGMAERDEVLRGRGSGTTLWGGIIIKRRGYEII